MAGQLLTPEVPEDYYRRIYLAEEDDPWYGGMREIALALAGDRLTRPDATVLDAGCGTGGFLAWVERIGSPSLLAGADVAENAIALAAQRVPGADLHVAALRELPFADETFDVVVSNDVLQHVHEDDVAASLAELRRVMRAGGVLLLRTNGARRLRIEQGDWRAYDRRTLVSYVERAGFSVERATYANTVASLYGAARGRLPHAPSAERDGIPTTLQRGPRSFVEKLLLRAEATLLRVSRSRLPYGHTLFVVGRRA